MTDLAALADKIEGFFARNEPDETMVKVEIVVPDRARLFAELPLPAILTALRASRPEPAADVVEVVAELLFTLDWDELCAIEDCRRAAERLLGALPRPEADEGAVRKADEIFDDITRGGPTVDAVMREDWATVAEWMRQRAEDGLAVTRAALAAAQEDGR